MTRQITVWVILALAVVGGGVAWKSHTSKSVPETVPASSAAPAPQTLELLATDVTQVQSGDLQQVLQVSGSLRALNQASVKAKVAGEVVQVLVREGEAVQAGQVLAKIEQADYLARIEQNKGALRAAQGQLEIASNARENNRQLRRQNFISKNALDNAESQYAIAQANLESAKAVLDVSQKALRDTVVLAPIAGTVSARNVQPGEKVSPDMRLLDVVDLRQMEIEIAVPSSEIAKVVVGQTVQVEVEGVAQPQAGQISRINPAVQSGSRSILAYVKLENPKQQLRVGMFAQARVVVGSRPNVLKVPHSALYYEQDDASAEKRRARIYLIENGKLRALPVVTGLSGENGDGGAVEISGDVKPGAQIVRTNLGLLKNGAPVKIASSANTAGK